MNLRKIAGAAVLSVSTLATSACRRGPLHEASEVPQKIVKSVNLLSKASNMSSDNCNISLGRDTLEISEDIINNPYKFLGEAIEKASSESPSVQTGYYTTYYPLKVGDITIMQEQVNPIYTKQYVGCKAIVENKIFTDKKSENLYLPVEYFGKPNPELKK